MKEEFTNYARTVMWSRKFYGISQPRDMSQNALPAESSYCSAVNV